MSPFPQFDDFQKLAAQIAPSETPSWLAKYLIWQSQDISAAVWFDRHRRSRAEYLQIFTELLQPPVCNNKLRELKRVVGCAPFDRSLSLLTGSSDLEHQIRWLLQSITASNGNARSARGKYLFDDEVHPKTLCAGLVLELFEFFQASNLLNGRRRAQFASALYELCVPISEREKDWATHPFDSWRPHFERKQENVIVQSRRKAWRLTIRQVAGRGRIPYSHLDMASPPNLSTESFEDTLIT